MKPTFLATSFTALVAVACSAEPSSVTEASNVETSSLFGEYHVYERNLDESYSFDGALAELSLTKVGDGCQYQALQVTGGCSRTNACLKEMFSAGEHVNEIHGACTLKGDRLVLEGERQDLVFTIKASKGERGSGIELESAAGTPLNRAGTAAFLKRTERTAKEAGRRAFFGKPLRGLARRLNPSEALTALPVAVQQEVRRIQDQQEPLNGGYFSFELDGLFGVYATSFDTVPIAYAVGYQHEGDHCGYEVFTVDAQTAKEADHFTEGDCGQ